MTMIGFFAALGAAVSTLIAFLMGRLSWIIAGNIYGGILGAYRMRRLLHQDGASRIGHWRTIKVGLHCWPGRRYRDGIGEYWRLGDMEVPLDGRDPIRTIYPA